MNEHANVVNVARHHPAGGRRDEVAGMLRVLAEDARKAPGCFGAQITSSDRDRDALVLISRWESAEAMRTRLEFRDLLIDVNERRIYKSGKEVELTHTEFDLLTFLASNAGKVLSREKILNSIWGYEYPIETRVIDVHIRNLRRKIETQPARPYYILAVPGIGYRFTNARPV